MGDARIRLLKRAADGPFDQSNTIVARPGDAGFEELLDLVALGMLFCASTESSCGIQFWVTMPGLAFLRALESEK